MTTLSDLVIRTQRRVLSDLREETDTLGANMAQTDQSFTLGAGQSLGSIQPGALVQIDLELMKVTGATPPTGPINVLRGYYDSIQVAHLANAEVVVNPRYPAVDIITAINEDIDDLSGPTNGLFQMLEVTLTYIPVQVGYDLTGLQDSDVSEICEVRVYEYGPSQKFPTIPMSKVKLQRNADTSVFPSGMSVTLDESGYPGRPIRVQYKSPYSTPLVNATDDVLAVTGLHSQAHDIPVLGAAARLTTFRELKRTFSEAQGEPRRAQEVPVGASETAAKGLWALRQQRIDAERTRLERRYPRFNR